MKKRVIANLLAMFMTLVVIFGAFSGSNAYAAADYSTVRVKLSNANDGVLNITLNGLYTIGTNGASVTGDMIVQKSGANIIMKNKATNQVVYNGSGFRLIRSANQNGKNGLIRMYNAVHGWRNYLGDMDFSVDSNGAFLVVNYIPIEHYLYGVVAYEMSDGFPLEALKAQAVAARGYVAGRIGSYSKYDLGDTPKDQVYKGYHPSNTKVKQAVDETQGQILTYKNRVILPYYGASNGGQTELTKNVWSNEMAYCVMKDDPYDLRNPSSLSQKIFFPKTVSTSTPIDSKLEKFLKVTAAPTLQKKGYSTYANQMEVLGISSLKASDAKYADPSRSFTKATAVVRMRVMKDSGAKSGMVTKNIKQGTKPEKPAFKATGTNSATGGPLYVDQKGNICDEETMKWYLAEYEAELTEWESGDVSLSNAATGLTGDTEEIDVTVKFTIYDLKEKTKGYRLFTNDNLRMYWSEEAEDGSGFSLVNVRFGHGVGMSQRGAQQMANEGKTYKDILDFYFEPCELKTFDYRKPGLNEIVSLDVVTSTSIAANEDIMPENAEDIPEENNSKKTTGSSTLGTITNDTELFESVNAAKPIKTLKATTEVNLIMQQGDWILVSTLTGETGLVQAKYVKIDSGSGIMQKNASILSEPEKQGTKIGTAKKNIAVTIFEKVGSYYSVATEDGWEGYVPASSVALIIDDATIVLDQSNKYGYALTKTKGYVTKDQKAAAFNMEAGQIFIVQSQTADGAAYHVTYRGQKGYVAKSDIKLIAKNAVHTDLQKLIALHFPNNEKTANRIAEEPIVTEETVNETQQTTAEPTIPVEKQQEEVAPTLSANPENEKTDNVDESESYLAPEETVEAKQKRTEAMEKGLYHYSENLDVLSDLDQLEQYTDMDEESYLAASATGIEAPSIFEANAAAAIQGTVQGQTVNLRKTASTGSTIIRQLANGSTVTVLGKSGGFYKIRDERGNEGYVSSSFVIVDTGKTGLIIADGVNMRKNASATSAVVELLIKNSTVQVLGAEGSYFKVKAASGKTGYVSDEYCKVGAVAIPVVSGGTGSSSASNSTTTTANKKAVASGVVSQSVNLRQSASTNSKILGKIPSGTRINIISKSKQGQFYRVIYNGQTGYISMQYLPTSTLKKPITGSGVATSTTTSKNTTATDSKKKAVARSDVNIRTEAGTKIGSLEKGTEVSVLGSSGNRYKISKDGMVGYVEDQYLTVLK